MKSITDGFDELKDNVLGLTGCGIGNPPHFRHRRVMQNLCANPPEVDGAALADSMIDQLVRNWRAGSSRYGASPSRENWRFTAAGTMQAHNRSPEVTFERVLAQFGGDSWANQVPTCSGIVGWRADTRRSIDLVERFDDSTYDLIELKIESDTPVFAALEILDYGALYAFCRLNADELDYGPGFSQILDAEHIGLRVLAPPPFYRFKTRGGFAPLDLAWLEDVLNDAVRRLASRIGIEVDFRFDVFPDRFTWDPADHSNGQHAIEMMDDRRPLIAAKAG